MRVSRWVVLAAGCALVTAVPTAAQASSGRAARSVQHPPFVVMGHVRQVTYRDAVNDKSLRWFSDDQTVLEIPEPTYYVAQSTVVDGSLAFDFGLEATSDQVIVASQIAFDEETGEAVLAVGIPTTSSLQELADGGADIPDWVLRVDGTATTSTPVIATATWQPGRGAFGTFWTDPIGITVSDVITEIRWEYNGTNVRAPVVDDVTYVFSPNGWTQVSHFRGAYLNAARTVATGYSQAHHKTSSWFPSPTCGTTRVKYYSNSAYGGWTGNISGGVTTWTEGPCGGLLSVQAFAFRGQV